MPGNLTSETCPYMKGFLRAVDEEFAPGERLPGRLEHVRGELISGKTLAQIARDAVENGDIALPSDAVRHFVEHWLEGETARMFPQIPTDTIKSVIAGGYQSAVEKALDQGDSKTGRLPITSLWVGLADDRVFDVVVSVTYDVSVQVTIVTPRPRAAAGTQAEVPPDQVWVTRAMSSSAAIGDLKKQLSEAGATGEDLEILNSAGGEAQPGEVGTFRMRA